MKCCGSAEAGAELTTNDSIRREMMALTGVMSMQISQLSCSTVSMLLVLLVRSASPCQVTIAPEHRIVPIRTMSQDVEVLYGDPEKVGEPFVMRIRELPGGVIPPHKHPVDEHITVVQGTLYFAVGETFDRAVVHELKTGSYAFIPKGTTMFGYTPDAAIVQVHGVGPFHIHWRAGNEWRDKLKTLDDPDAASVFKFRKGDKVVTTRGRGRIRQGYDSGEIIGYEIDGENGTLFMAEEKDLRPWK
jgi:quercetin dioxygenase-like cupin family protein